MATYLGPGDNVYAAPGAGPAVVYGQDGNDKITGTAGNDALNGGKGADTLRGGAGSDTFVFVAGDLVASLGQGNGYGGNVDYIQDFQGAGVHNKAAAAVGTDQDLIQLYGFGAGSTLDFVKDVNPNLAYYYVTDPTNSANNGYILLGSTNGAHLGAGDYVFK